MNEIEAISVLETRIKYPNIDTYGGMCEAEYQQEAVVLAIEALREQAERDKGCEHCKQFPFKSEEMQVYDVVRIVCFRQPSETEGTQ